MKQKLKNIIVRMRGSTAVKLNRLFHAFFFLSNKELRITERMCRSNKIYDYVELRKYQ